jgi:zinc protease
MPTAKTIRWAAAVAVLAAACSGAGPSAFQTTTSAPTTSMASTTTRPATSTTTTTIPPTTTTTTRPPAVVPVFADDAVPIDLDPAVTVGRLDNGLAYYVRENDSPGGRAQLRLVVHAGSAHQSDRQAGVAHFVEHMLFNGTEAYPANELVAVLERFGAEFGPDINAYTSYEETVYSLEVPTDDPAFMATAFDVLGEWAAAATLDPDQIDLERGVLIEEWRVRDQGFWGRYQVAVTDLLLAGTPYAGRLPLGDPDEVDAVTQAGLRDFYQAWYRPGLMAVVAVGDFAAADVEQLIRDRFEALADPAEPRPEPDLFALPFAAPEILVLADPEAPFSFVELNYPVPAGEGAGTVGAVRRDLALSAAFEMLTTRLEEDTLRGLTPYYDPSGAANDFVRTLGTDGVFAYANPDDLADTARAALTEVERARRFGFSQDELDRVAEDLRAAVAGDYREEGSKQDWQYAADYVEQYLGGAPAAEARDWRDLRLRLINELTVEQVAATFAATIEATAPLVIVGAPEASAGAIPTEPELLAIAAAVADGALEPRPADGAATPELPATPDPAEVVEESTLPETALPLIEYENGLRFTYFPTTIHEGYVELLALSPGGWVTLDTGEVAEAKLIGDIVGASGVATLDQVALNRLLIGTEVGVTPFIDEMQEGLSGWAATADLEVLFRLAHFYMAEPRFDPVAIGIVQKRLHQPVEAPETLVDVALDVAIADARFGGDPRYSPLPSPEELASLDIDQAEALFADRFGNAGDFTFVLVGDFSPTEAEWLAARYLGTLPADGDPEGYEAERPAPPDGVVARTVEAGTGERGATTLTFSTAEALTPESRVDLDILEAVIDQRLVTHIREELSASYSPSVTFAYVDEPEDRVEITIRVDGDPANLDVVAAALLADLEDLLANGPTRDEFEIAQQQVLRGYELVDNHGLAEAALFSAYYPDELLMEIITRYDRAGAATLGDIRAIARSTIDLEQYIRVDLVPIGFAG